MRTSKNLIISYNFLVSRFVLWRCFISFFYIKVNIFSLILEYLKVNIFSIILEYRSHE